MADFAPFWEDKDFGGSLDSSALPGHADDIFSTSLFCDEETLDAVVPEPAEDGSCLMSNVPDAPEDNGSPVGSSNWRNFLDNNCPLRRRVSVTVTGKRKHVSEISPERPASCFLKRPKSVNPTYAPPVEEQPSFCYPPQFESNGEFTGRGNTKRYTFGYGSIRDQGLHVHPDGTAVHASVSATAKRNAYRRSTPAIGVFCDFGNASQTAMPYFDDIAEQGSGMQPAADSKESLSQSKLESALSGLDVQGEAFSDFVGLNISTGEYGTQDAVPSTVTYESQDSAPMSDFTDSGAEPDSPDGHVSKALANRLLSICAARFSDDSSVTSSLTSGHLHLPATSATGLPEVSSAVKAVTLAAQAYSAELSNTSTGRRELQQVRNAKRQGLRPGGLRQGSLRQGAFALKTKQRKPLLAMRVQRKRGSLTKFDEPVIPVGEDAERGEDGGSALQLYISSSVGGGMDC